MNTRIIHPNILPFTISTVMVLTLCCIAPVFYSAGLLQRTMKDPFDLAVDAAKFVRCPFLDGLHCCCLYT